MDNRRPPSKPVLIAAILPFIIAVACMFGFGHFGISLGVTISIIGLVVYYVIFGIVYAVVSLKHDEAQREIDRAASPQLKAATIFLMIFSVLTVGGAFVGFFTDNDKIAFACVGAFLIGIFLFVVILALSSRVRTKPPKSANKTGEGVCVHCVSAFGISFFSGFEKADGRTVPKYGGKTSYKVIVELDGRQLTAYSHAPFKKGETVEVAYSDKSKKCYII